MPLGQALKPHVWIIVWCKQCWHSVEPNVAQLIERHGTATVLINRAARLVCSNAGPAG